MASNKLRSGEKRKSLHEAIREIDGNEAWFKLMQDGKTDEAVESLLQGIPKKTTKFSKTSAPKAKGKKGAAEAGFEVSILPESLQSYHDTMYQRFIEIVAKVPEQTVSIEFFHVISIVNKLYKGPTHSSPGNQHPSNWILLYPSS